MRFVVVGTAQDGGLPHVGCRCLHCKAARSGVIQRRLAPSAAVVDPEGGRAWLVDASPDLPEQLEALRDHLGGHETRGIPLTAILLTHLHMGHYWGLGHLGKEGMMPRDLPLMAPPGAADFLRTHRPFRDLVEHGALEVRPVEPGRGIPLAEDLIATPHRIPHRRDVSDTVAWLFQGPRWSVLYMPDVDHMDESTAALVDGADLALVDGTFFTRGEIPGAMDWIPHPPVETSMEALRPAVEAGTRVAFTHLNHTNPLCDPRSEEMRRVIRAGFGVALDGYAVDI